MTSRILQQDSGLILTEASEPIINEDFIGADGFSTGNPVLQTAAITQDHVTNVISIVTGQPVISTTAITQNHVTNVNSVVTGQPIVSPTAITQAQSLSSTNITTGNVVVLPTAITQDHNVQASSILTGNPVVSLATLTEEENFSVDSILTGNPTLGSTSLTQVNNLLAENIVTRRPDVGKPFDPNVVITEEIDQMFGGWQRRTYEVPDGRLVQAEREIQATYSDVVSIDRKAKSLLKFGRSAQLSTSGLQTVWTVGGNETYVSTNSISRISSSSASDTEVIRIEGHTVSDGKFTFVVQNVTLSGQTKVTLDTALARVSRISNNGGTELVGRVVVYEDTTIVGGIPSDATKIHIDIPLGFQQSLKSATTFSDQDYYVMTGFYGSVSAKTSAAVDFYVEIREPNGVFLPMACFTASSTGGNSDISLDPAIIAPKNSDLRVRCETQDNNAVVFGIFKGYLAKVL